MGWKRRPTGFIPVAEGELNAMTRAIALQALTGVIEMSPVGNPDNWKYPAPPGYVGGAFRGNHTVSVNTVDPSYDTAKIDDTGQATTAAGASKIGVARNPYQIIYIQNNLPYSEKLESGYSEQAPHGVYQVTFDSLRAATE